MNVIFNENINKIMLYFNWFDTNWNYFAVSKPVKLSYTYFFINYLNNLKENW